MSEDQARATFDLLSRHFSPGAALAAKVMGGGATETAADGATVVLSDGRRALDFGSYGAPLLGHRHPAVLAALSDSLSAMPTATKTLANPTMARFCGELASRCGDPLRRVWTGSNGSDAVEVALKLARRSSGRMEVLFVAGGFHGKSLGALALTTNPAYRQGLEPLLRYASALQPDDPEAVRRATEKTEVAALIFEPVQGEGGVRPLAPEVLRRWADDVHRAGAFVISDEVQTGLGRCGPFSLSLAADLSPDAVLFGKALGGGLIPLSAVVATEALAAPLTEDPTWHTATFAGHPLASAAGLATLTAVEEAAAHGAMVGQRLGAGLVALAEEHPKIIVEVRGQGLLWGLEMASAGAAGAALIELASAGLLVSPCLGSSGTLRLLPPMVTSFSQVDQALAILDAALPSLQAYV